MIMPELPGDIKKRLPKKAYEEVLSALDDLYYDMVDDEEFMIERQFYIDLIRDLWPLPEEPESTQNPLKM